MLGRAGQLLRRTPKGPTIYLHIGAMKTGTTYLQQLMNASQEDLARAGYLFPGPRWSRQSAAVRAKLYGKDDPRGGDPALWTDLAAEMLAFPGKAAVLSMEFLSFLESDGAADLLESFPGADVHIVLTVRDARTAVPAQWQTNCRNGGTTEFDRFVLGTRRVVRDSSAHRSKAAKLFDRTQNIPRMLDVWVPLVGRKNVHVVTVPPRGSDPALLWHRFAQVIGVDPAVATQQPSHWNPSIGYPSSELTRLINVELGTVPKAAYWRVVKAHLTRDVLGARAHLERPVRLDERALNVLGRWNDRVREAIDAAGVHVVGSLDDLPTGPPPEGTPQEIVPPSENELLEAAATARDGLIELQARYRGILSGDAPEPSQEHEVTEPGRWSQAVAPVQTAVQELARLVQEDIELDLQVRSAKRSAVTTSASG